MAGYEQTNPRELEELQSSDSEEHHSTSESESEDDVEVETRSNDGPADKDKDNNPDSPQNGPSASATASTEQPAPSAKDIAKDKEDEETFIDEQLVQMMAQMSTSDDMKTLRDSLFPKAKFYADTYNELKKRIKKIEKKEKSEVKKALSAEKKEQEKEIKKEQRETEMVINVSFNERNYALTLKGTSTFADLRDAFVHVSGVSKKAAKKFSYSFNSMFLGDHPRRTLLGWKMRDGDQVQVSVGGSGGAGRKRTSAEASENIDFNFSFTPPKVNEKDIVEVKTALSLQSVDVEQWVKSLNVKQSSDLLDVIDNQSKTGDLKAFVSPYMQFIREYYALKDWFFKNLMSVINLHQKTLI